MCPLIYLAIIIYGNQYLAIIIYIFLKNHMAFCITVSLPAPCSQLGFRSQITNPDHYIENDEAAFYTFIFLHLQYDRNLMVLLFL